MARHRICSSFKLILKKKSTDDKNNANKNAAGMQHTPPRDIFNAKKIILKLDLCMESLKKIGKEMPKIESEKPIYNVNQGP